MCKEWLEINVATNVFEGPSNESVTVPTLFRARDNLGELCITQGSGDLSIVRDDNHLLAVTIPGYALFTEETLQLNSINFSPRPLLAGKEQCRSIRSVLNFNQLAYVPSFGIDYGAN